MNSNDITAFILNCLKPFKWLIAGQFFVGVVWAVDLSLRPYLVKTMLDKIATLDPSQAYKCFAYPGSFLYFYVGACKICFQYL